MKNLKTLVIVALLTIVIYMGIHDNFSFEKPSQASNYPPSVDLKEAVNQILDEVLPNRILDLNWENVINYLTFFESLDGFSVANVAFSSEDVKFSLPATNNNEAKLQKRPQWNPLLSFTSVSYFRTSILLSSVTSIKGQLVIGAATADGAGGYTTNNKKYGFYINGSNLYGVVGNGTSESTILLQTIAASTVYNLTAKFFPGSKVIFYVNGIEKGVLTTNLPTTGTTAEPNLLTFSIVNNEAVAKTMDISYFQYSQQKVKVY